MVSSVCHESCSPIMRTNSSARVLNIDNAKDYSVPLQVETSVEYDLPSHIYPPKGAQPILMIHPAYLDSSRLRKSPVSSPAISPNPGVNLPLSALQVYNKQIERKTSAARALNLKTVCSCGILNCNSSLSKLNNASKINNEQSSSILGNRKSRVINEVVKNTLQSTEFNPQHIHIEQQKAKYKQLQQPNQLHLQNVQMQIYERKKLHARQREQLQVQQNSEIVSWGANATRCMGPCCQPRIAALPPTQAEFLAPGLPPSLIRTPTRGSGVSSPKLRARTRRAINVANSVNLPEYLGNSRSSRNSSSSGFMGGFNRSANGSFLAAAPAPITTHQVASALDVVRGRCLTPHSLFTSQHHKSLHSSMNSATAAVSTLLPPTVGQSRDSGCSLGADLNGSISSDNPSVVNNGKWSWGAVDSGFSTPVDFIDEQVIPMDIYESSTPQGKKYSSRTPVSPLSSALSNVSGGVACPSKCGLHWMKELGNQFPVDSPKGSCSVNPYSIISSSSAKNLTYGASNNSNLYWMADLATPLGSASSSSINRIHNSFLPASNPHYIPQPIWNLAY